MTNSATSLANSIDPLDVAIDPNMMTVGHMLKLLSRYPADAPFAIGMFESENARAVPDFYPLTRLVYGSVAAADVMRTEENDESQIDAVVFMFDSGVTGEEFDGPHDGDVDHNAAIIASATAAQAETKPRRRSRVEPLPNTQTNVVPLLPPSMRHK